MRVDILSSLSLITNLFRHESRPFSGIIALASHADRTEHYYFEEEEEKQFYDKCSQYSHVFCI